MDKEKAKHLAGIAYVNLATFVWATNMVLGRLLKDSIGPVTLSAARFCIAAMVLALLLRTQSLENRRFGRDFWLLAAIAVAGVILFSPLLYWGLRYTTAVNSTLINGFGPLLTGLFAASFLGSPMTGRQVAGALAALAGVLYLISGGSLAFWQNAQYNIGDFIILGAVAVWGLYSVAASRVMRQRSSLSATALSTFLGLPFLCLLAVWELQSIPVRLDIGLALIVLYLGVVPAAVGFYAWNAGVARLGPSGAMVFYNTLPLYGAILGVVFLGEPFGRPHLIGGLLIVGGALWAARRRGG